MAWLESKDGVFRIRFRYGGTKHLLPLRTTDPQEADDAIARFRANLRLIDRGVLEPPPTGVDLGVYIVSAGKLTARPATAERPGRSTLGDLLDSYLADFPQNSKEATTWKTERIHVGHLRRLLDVRLPLAAITDRHLQEYVDARSRGDGKEVRPVRRETVQKEIGTFSAIWNKWGVPQGLVNGPAPVTRLVYPKGSAKLPFQTREQIERQIARGGLSPEQESDLWECLFLTLSEVEELLDHVQAGRRPAYVYPMVVFAAHTGARRSEIRRAMVTDFDFDRGSVLVRERKKDPSRAETYRTVPMSPRLESAVREWLGRHPGGPHAFCTPAGRPITDHYATKVILGAVRGSRWSVLPGWHCLRHSFVSNCAAGGVDQRLIDHWVGHTTEAMRRRYSHLLPAVSQAAHRSVFGVPK